MTDDPFAETKALIAGYAIMAAGSKDEAVDLAGRFLQVMRAGETKIRLMHETPAIAVEEHQPSGAAV